MNCRECGAFTSEPARVCRPCQARLLDEGRVWPGYEIPPWLDAADESVVRAERRRRGLEVASAEEVVAEVKAKHELESEAVRRRPSERVPKLQRYVDRVSAEFAPKKRGRPRKHPVK